MAKIDPIVFAHNVNAGNAELDEMVNYWRIVRRTRTFQDTILDMHQSVCASKPTEGDLYRLLVLAVARLAGEQ